MKCGDFPIWRIMREFLEESRYVDYSAANIRETARLLFTGHNTPEEKARAAFEFVRDAIPHSFDCGASVITAKASDVLRHKTGICHAKSNLLAALLRSQGIPVGFRYQHLTLLDDDSAGYCLHCYNAAYIGERWVEIDARGNKKGVNAQFSLISPQLAFPNRPEYDEYTFDGIYAFPDLPTMTLLERAKSLEDVADGLPEFPSSPPQA